MDPPEHGQYRRTLTKEFMMKRIDELRPFVKTTFDTLLDQMIANGAPADFIVDHRTAHGALHPNLKVNDWVGETLTPGGLVQYLHVHGPLPYHATQHGGSSDAAE